MNIVKVNSVGYTKAKNFQKPIKIIDRKLLQKNSNLLNLNGPWEKEEAKGWVALYTVGNSGLAAAMAQAPGIDEAALASVEVIMATHIFNKIYKFNFSSTILKSLAMGVTGHAVGKTAFKLVSKSITWIPILGNAVNAVISGSTTAALGAAIINAAEKLDDARRRGKKLDEIIKKLGE